MEKPCRIFISISDTALKEEVFEENFPENKLSDEVCSLINFFILHIAEIHFIHFFF